MPDLTPARKFNPRRRRSRQTGGHRRPASAAARYRAHYKFRQPVSGIPYCHAGAAVVGDPLQVRINGELRKVGLAELRLLLRSECAFDLWLAFLRAREVDTARCERALRWLNRSIPTPRGKRPDPENSGAYSDRQLERAVRTLERAGLVVRLAKRFGVTTTDEHGRRQRPELRLTVTRLVLGQVVGATAYAPPEARQRLEDLPRRGRPFGWRAQKSRGAQESSPAFNPLLNTSQLQVAGKEGASFNLILSDQIKTPIKKSVNPPKSGGCRAGEAARVGSDFFGDQGAADCPASPAQEELLAQVPAGSPDPTGLWMLGGECLRPQADWLPSLPYELVPLARTPGPPCLAADDPPLRWANILARVYRGALEHLCAAKTRAFARGVTEKAKSFPGLVACARKLVEHDVAPARWARFAVERWRKSGRGGGKPPPIGYVFSAAQVEQARGWCREETRDAFPLRAYSSPDVVELASEWYAARARALPLKSAAEVDAVLAEIWPGRTFADRVAACRAWSESRQAELRARAAAFEWVWEEVQ